MKANILGTEYEIVFKDYKDEPAFERRGIDGYCDNIDKVLCIGNLKTFPQWEDETEEYCKKAEKETLRHEIIHAFLGESGLQGSTAVIDDRGWSKNEEMIDFFAIQFPKISKVFEDLNITS